jgi:hypothetical protein
VLKTSLANWRNSSGHTVLLLTVSVCLLQACSAPPTSSEQASHVASIRNNLQLPSVDPQLLLNLETAVER